MGAILATIPLGVTTLSRLQFALTAIVHFAFVATTTGMLLTTIIFEFIYAYGRGNKDQYGRLALFFSRIFIFSFATGVVTGLIMEFQFGLNWSAFARLMGDIVGVPLAIESMLAFFLESTIIGAWRFTWGMLNKKAHAWLGLAMLLSSLTSVIWIIAINAFMQNPYGFHMEGKHARLNSFITLLQNPQYLPEVLHVLFAILIVGGFLTAGISAWQILHQRDVQAFKVAVQIGLLIALPAAFIQPLQGDNQAAATVMLQPMKFTAIEGRYDNEGSKTTGAPWALAATIDEKNHKVNAITVPAMGTYFGTGKFTGMMPGMNMVAKIYHAKFDKTVAKSYDGQMDYYPPVTLLFWAMHWMVYAGYFFTMFALAATILLHRRHKLIEEHRKTLRTLGWVLWLPYITITAGWIVAEVGRYPFVVYGLLTQYDAVSPNLTMPVVAVSLGLFFIVDAFLITTMITLSHRALKRGLPALSGLEHDEDDDTSFTGGVSHA
ncbi:cytochrome ubiquinol oxidase subunit I [Schleiferilactobacillus shenzhenensis]|uniref:CydA n=1 Tax=Schleiferilactobacillus shenzhenensis LY-73 TaxID=1231336 RepID=U4TUW2_9LACO|nr:cytochrome ubiquinol oxidase subunit I [Schleiferilactobacillus shenzhenensis]ERL65663.1 CydA [Schleiferilactobacillus shenzhenensis LY-73]